MVVDIYYNIKDQNLIEKPLETTENEYINYTENAGPPAYKEAAVHCFPRVIDESTGLSSGCVLPHIDFLDEKSDKIIKNVIL